MPTMRNCLPSATMNVSPTLEHSLREHEDERHGRILAVTPSPEPSPYRSRLPRGWRAEDILDLPETSDFVTFAQAANIMNVEQDEIVSMVRSGHLEARGNGVRPALVSVLR